MDSNFYLRQARFQMANGRNVTITGSGEDIERLVAQYKLLQQFSEAARDMLTLIDTGVRTGYITMPNNLDDLAYKLPVRLKNLLLSARGERPSDQAVQSGFMSWLSPHKHGFICLRLGDFMAPPPDQINLWTNVPHTVIHHSPTGFEWGYGGSGPADLALNILEHYFSVMSIEGPRVDCYRGTVCAWAWVLHQDFNRDFIATMPKEGGRILWEDVAGWVNSKMENGGIDASDF